MSFEQDASRLDRFTAFARSVRAGHSDLSDKEQCALVARRLDYLNRNSPSTNGLLAIALMRLVKSEDSQAMR